MGHVAPPAAERPSLPFLARPAGYPCGSRRAAVEPGHGSWVSGGGTTTTGFPQMAQATVSPGWRCCSGRRLPGQRGGSGGGRGGPVRLRFDVTSAGSHGGRTSRIVACS